MKAIRLNEDQLHRIVRESVGKVMKEAYGTPASKDWERFKDLNTASNPLTAHLTERDPDGLISSVSRINASLSEIHYSLVPLVSNLQRYGKDVKRIGSALDKKCEDMYRMLQLLMNKLQMETGEQPSASRQNKWRYYDSDKSKDGRRKSDEMFGHRQ